MLDSALWLLTMTAVVLLVPASAALLGIERHRHLAALQDTSRRVRLVAAATLVGLAALGVAALLRAEPLTAVVVAVVLSGSVLAWAPMSTTWAVRGIVVWALLVTGAVSFLTWVVQQTVAARMDVAQLVVTAAVGILLVLLLARGQRYVRESIGAHAGLEAGSGRGPLPVVRPLGTLVALLAAGGVVVAVADDSSGPGESSPQAGPSASLTAGTTSGGGAPTSAPTPTLGPAPVGPSAVDAGLVGGRSSFQGGIRATTARLVSSAPVGVPVPATGPSTGASSGPSAGHLAGPSTGPGRSGQEGSGGSEPTGGGAPGGAEGGSSGGGGGTDGGPTGPGSGSGSGGTDAGSGSGGTDAGSGSGGTDAGSGSGGTDAGAEPDSGTDPGTGTVVDPEPVRALRTPGYAKPKPHRPTDAPSPGLGRLNHLAEPSPTPSLYTPPPTLLPIPAPTPLLPPLYVLATLPAEVLKTPGWAKEGPRGPKDLR